jgi:hypothetical protein
MWSLLNIAHLAREQFRRGRYIQSGRRGWGVVDERPDENVAAPESLADDLLGRILGPAPGATFCKL